METYNITQHLISIRELINELNLKLMSISVLQAQQLQIGSPAEQLLETQLLQFEATLYKHYLEVGHHFYHGTHTLGELNKMAEEASSASIKKNTLFDETDPNDITENPSL